VVFALVDKRGRVIGTYPVRLGQGATEAKRILPKPGPGQRIVAYSTNATGVSANAPAGGNVVNLPTTLAPDRPTGGWELFGERLTAPLIFAGGSAQLTEEGMAALDRIARQVKARGNGRVFVSGFARQGGGTEQYLAILSKRRAHAVAQYLSARGVRQWIRYWGIGARTEAVGVPDDRQVQVTWSAQAIPKTMRSAVWMQAPQADPPAG
jgi:outer membrane protein OmpA-like peptidoglycan-associated protein